MERIGPLLEKKRRERDLSFAQIREVTGIEERYARALEGDDYSPFHSEAEAKSYLRVYARYLGLVLQEAGVAFEGVGKRGAQPLEMSSEEMLRRRVQEASPPATSPIFLPVATVLTLILIVGLLILAYLLLFYGG